MSDTFNLLINTKDLIATNAYNNEFILPLDQPIKGFSKVALIQASIVYSSPNIALIYNNNTISFTYNSVNYTITFLDGLYGIDSINETISEFFINNSLPNNIFNFVPDEATSRVTMNIITVLPFSITFTSAINYFLFEYMGFKQNNTFTTSINKNVDGTEQVSLNRLINYYVVTNFGSSNTLYNNRHGLDICACININVSPASAVNYEPIHYQECACNNEIQELRIAIRDQNLNAIIINESYTMRFKFYN